MKPKKAPDQETLDLLLALESPEKLTAWFESQGFPTDDEPVCLAKLPKSEWTCCVKVMPTPAIQRYLDSDDILTNHTIDMMEEALETAYGTGPEWCITSMRSGNEQDQTLSLGYFYLIEP